MSNGWCQDGSYAHPIPAPHGRYHHFLDFDDAERYRLRLTAVREPLRDVSDTSGLAV